MSQPVDGRYRVYCHDSVNKLVTAQWIDASTDDQAVGIVQDLYSHLTCEIWTGRRLVAKVGESSLAKPARIDPGAAGLNPQP